MKEINIHKEILITLKDKKIGIFSLVDKLIQKRLGKQGTRDLLDLFYFEDNIKAVSERSVKSLKQQGADFIIAIANMDGYYNE